MAAGRDGSEFRTAAGSAPPAVHRRLLLPAISAHFATTSPPLEVQLADAWARAQLACGLRLAMRAFVIFHTRPGCGLCTGGCARFVFAAAQNGVAVLAPALLAFVLTNRRGTTFCALAILGDCACKFQNFSAPPLLLEQVENPENLGTRELFWPGKIF